jgi:hypothetical protein
MQWDVLPQDQGMVKEYYRVKESKKGQFADIIIMSGNGGS